MSPSEFPLATTLSQIILLNANLVVTSKEVDISIDLLHTGASQVLDEFITDSNTLSNIYSHGCWCAKLSQTNNNEMLGGTTTVDALD